MQKENIARILLIDDHQIILEGIRLMLKGHPGIEICGSATSAEEGLALAHRYKPDIIIADISMPGMNGIALAERLKEELPDIRVLMLSMHSGEDYICRLVQAGIRGFLTKQTTNREELSGAISKLMQGENYFSPDITRVIMQKYLHHNKTVQSTEIKPASLTPRERDIIALYANGLSNQEIADSLHISIKTVDAHKNNIMQKFRFKSTVDMVKYAIRHNLADL